MVLACDAFHGGNRVRSSLGTPRRQKKPWASEADGPTSAGDSPIGRDTLEFGNPRNAVGNREGDVSRGGDAVLSWLSRDWMGDGAAQLDRSGDRERQDHYPGYVFAWEALLWGFFGGAAIEGLDFATAIRRVRTWPWKVQGEPGFGPYVVSVIIRCGVGGGLATAACASDQLTTVFSAVTTGVAAPLVLENLAKQLPAAYRQGGQLPSAETGSGADVASPSPARTPNKAPAASKSAAAKRTTAKVPTARESATRVSAPGTETAAGSKRGVKHLPSPADESPGIAGGTRTPVRSTGAGRRPGDSRTQGATVSNKVGEMSAGDGHASDPEKDCGELDAASSKNFTESTGEDSVCSNGNALHGVSADGVSGVPGKMRVGDGDA